MAAPCQIKLDALNRGRVAQCQLGVAAEPLVGLGRVMLPR